ncbi:membrane transport protein XK [Numida meleagris]|uniref:membrane transport protein XK n=1 Tax=Numida meleagris TaxID=8996 RepID=UPI000B3E2065|nr:membrane transport protein XK [Numida meleagris]
MQDPGGRHQSQLGTNQMPAPRQREAAVTERPTQAPSASPAGRLSFVWCPGLRLRVTQRDCKGFSCPQAHLVGLGWRGHPPSSSAQRAGPGRASAAPAPAPLRLRAAAAGLAAPSTGRRRHPVGRSGPRGVRRLRGERARRAAMKFPGSVLISLVLFVAETATALCLSAAYRAAGDRMWQWLTLLFALLPCALVQLSLVFIHRDVSRDRPLVLLLHLLQLGPLVRCVEVFYIYFRAGRVEEPYVSITKKRQMPKDGYSEEVEKEVGQAEGKLCTHRSAFSRASVIQAFLGSAPQLTLQLYICVLQQEITAARSIFMVLSLLSIVYGALRCNILAIKIKYDDYDVSVKPAAYLCIFMWRSFEIATRVTVLVLFSSVLQIWTLPVVLVNFFVFFFYPWILFWQSKSPFPENIEKALSRVGTTIVLCLLTFLYAGINMFCWSAVQVKLSDPDLINKSQNWYRLTVYYMLRFIENAFLLLMWYIYRTDIYLYVCAPLLVLQLLIAYCMAILFMLVFYQFCHPCKKLFSSSITEGLLSCFMFCFVCKSPKSSTLTDKADLKSSENADESQGSNKTIDSPNGNPHQSISSNA